MQNHLIRRVDDRTGLISTVAGAPTPGFGGDGGLRAKPFFEPHSIALDDRGCLYVADIGNHRIRRIDTRDGRIDSIAGNGNKLLRDGGSPAAIRFSAHALAIVGRTMWIALHEATASGGSISIR